MSAQHPILHSIEHLKAWNQTADHVDVHSIKGTCDFKTFIVGAINYSPFWMKALYAVRWGFVRVLGMKQEGLPTSIHYTAETLPMKKGESVGFFTVEEVQEDLLWAATASESHLTARLVFVREIQEDGTILFHLVTFVNYHNWKGPIYFNTIRPFHHLVVRAMMRSSVASSTPPRHNIFIRNTGRLTMWIALLHTFVGLWIFWKPLTDITQAGVFNSIEPHWDRGAAIWFMLWGVVLYMLGALVQWSYTKLQELPHFLGWSSLALSVLGGCLMPSSGFWLMLPVGIGMLCATSTPSLASDERLLQQKS